MEPPRTFHCNVFGSAVTKTICRSCGLDRCYQTEGETLQCCNPLSAAGCVGSRTDQCHVSVTECVQCGVDRIKFGALHASLVHHLHECNPIFVRDCHVKQCFVCVCVCVCVDTLNMSTG